MPTFFFSCLVVSMALSTLFKWMPTVVLLNPPELTRPEPSMERVIATLNAPEISNSSMESQTPQDGSPVPMTVRRHSYLVFNGTDMGSAANAGTVSHFSRFITIADTF